MNTKELIQDLTAGFCDPDFDALGRGLYCLLAKLGEHERLSKGFIAQWVEIGIKAGIEKAVTLQYALQDMRNNPGVESGVIIHDDAFEKHVARNVRETCKAILKAAAQAEETRKATI